MNILDKIFDLYYTTRDNAAGIGLYMARMIIEANLGGKLTASNISGRAEFKLAFSKNERG